jgi:hypothetical protein
MTLELSAEILTKALDDWEREPTAYDLTPYQCFVVGCPTEAHYLSQIARGHSPPEHVVDEAVANLRAWRLIGPRVGITWLGRRLLDSEPKRR